MTHKQHRPPPFSHLPHLPQALLLKSRIPDSQHLIHQQYLRVHMRRHRKRQPHIHPARVPLHRCIQELLYLSELHNLIELRIDLPLLHTQDGTIEVDILAARQFRMEARAHLQQTAHPATEDHFPLGGVGYAGEDLQQGGFACAVTADDADDLAAVDGEIDVAQGPEYFVLLVVIL